MIKKKLKVYRKYTKRFNSTNYIVIPEIRLSGKWLEKAGFKIGETVTIEITKNKITISI